MEPSINLSIEVVSVTPELAKEWLEGKNESNRAINWRQVAKWAELMVSGAWSVSASQLHFDRDGRLINGQHRLNAVIQLDQPVRMSVIRGCDASDYLKVDTGRGRIESQYLGAYGTDKKVAAHVIYMANYCGWRKKLPLSVEQTVHFADEWAVEFANWAPSAKHASRNTRIRTGVLLAMSAQASRTNGEPMLKPFLEALATGEGLFKSDPAYALIRKGNEIHGKPYEGESPYQAVYSYVVRAWNAYVSGSSLTAFRGIADVRIIGS